MRYIHLFYQNKIYSKEYKYKYTTRRWVDGTGIQKKLERNFFLNQNFNFFLNRNGTQAIGIPAFGTGIQNLSKKNKSIKKFKIKSEKAKN